MAERDLDGCLVSAPENIYYLTGLEHQGYFAYELLVVPREGDLFLVARQMERATLRDQIPWVTHVGYSDGIAALPPPQDREEDLVMGQKTEAGRSAGLRPWEMSYGVSVEGPTADSWDDAVEKTVTAVRDAGLAGGRLGLEMRASFLPVHLAHRIMGRLSTEEWTDASGLVDDCRLVQSPLEQAFTRKAAEISDSMMLAAIAAAGPGVPEHDVMAAVYDALFRRGGSYPGFIPLVRSTQTLEHEHGTWSSGKLRKGHLLFLEMSGCAGRYHAPLGRLVHIGRRASRSERVHGVCRKAQEAAAGAIKPGVTADTVYRAWEETVHEAGFGSYTRHHCGYAVGIGFPPSWSGSGTPRGLRGGSDLVLAEGMVFHLMSWLLRTGQGDSFLSDTVLVTADGCEFLTRAPQSILVR
jgi:Xaa-Pro dipeptidase